MKRSLAILLASVSLAACKLPVDPTTQTSLAKVEFTAETAYSAAGSAYMAVEASLPADTKAKAKTILLSILSCPQGASGPCTGYLVAARQALAASNADTLAQQVNAVVSAAAQVQALTKGH